MPSEIKIATVQILKQAPKDAVVAGAWVLKIKNAKRTQQVIENKNSGLAINLQSKRMRTIRRVSSEELRA
jgi:hypothetical protein